MSRWVVRSRRVCVLKQAQPLHDSVPMHYRKRRLVLLLVFLDVHFVEMEVCLEEIEEESLREGGL